MIIVTLAEVPGRRTVQALGVVTGEAIMGTNFFRDLFAGVRDFFGGRVGSYQKAMRDAKVATLDDMAEQAKALGADAIVGVTLTPYSIASDKDKLLGISGTGTAVRLG